LALLDAYSRTFRRPLTEVAGWTGLPNLGAPGSLPHVRYACVLASKDVRSLRRHVRLGRLFGLTDFKLKVGFDTDLERIREVARLLGPGLGTRVTLRLDANGGWDLARAASLLGKIGDLPITCVEQPLPKGEEGVMGELHQRTGAALMADESLVTEDDAEALADIAGMKWFNIRLAKNGGFLPTVRLAAAARRRGIGVLLGCLVGETSILSAAGRKVLECIPGIRFAEGSLGKILLKDDVVARPVRFGCGGRGRALPGPGFGVEVDQARVNRLCRERAREYRL
jgi:muconate cycloisomerase